MSKRFDDATKIFIEAAEIEAGKIQALIDKEEEKEEVDDEKTSELQDRLDSIQSAIEAVEEIEKETD